MRKVENYVRDERRRRGFQDPIRVSITMSGRLHSLAKKAVEEDPDIDRVSELMRKALVRELSRRGHEHEIPFVLKLRAKNVARDKILEIMSVKSMPISTHELVDHLQCNKRTMYAVLYELQQKNMVIKKYSKTVMISYDRRQKRGGKLTGEIIKVERPKDIAYWTLHPEAYQSRRTKHWVDRRRRNE